MDKLDFFKGKYDPVSLPVAEFVSERVLTLPLYADLKLKDLDRICNIIANLRSVK